MTDNAPNVKGNGPNLKKWSLIMAKAVITVSLIIWALSRVETENLAAAFASLPWWAPALSLLCLFFILAFNLWRWKFTLDILGAKQGARTTLSVILIGIFFNQLLPTGVAGDGYRILAIARRWGSWSLAAASVFADRVYALAALLALSGILIAFHPEAPEYIPMWLGPILVACGVSGPLFLVFGERLAARFFPDRFRFIHFLCQAIKAAATSVKGLVTCFGGAVAGQILIGLSFHVLLVGLGHAPSPWLSVLVTSLTLLAMLIPISIAGWGVREAAFLTLLAPVGVPGEVVLAASLIWGGVNMVIGVPGAVLFLRGRKIVTQGI